MRWLDIYKPDEIGKFDASYSHIDGMLNISKDVPYSNSHIRRAVHELTQRGQCELSLQLNEWRFQF